MWKVAAIVCVALVGCVQPKTSDDAQAERRAEYKTSSAERERLGREAEAQRVAALEARDRARLQERESALAQRREQAAKAVDADCSSDRDARMREVQRREDSIAHVNELIQWEIDHCKSVDNSKAVVRTVQDSRGVYHMVEGRDRGVDRVCDAKPPAEIAKVPADSLPIYRLSAPILDRNDQCRTSDEGARASH